MKRNLKINLTGLCLAALLGTSVSGGLTGCSPKAGTSASVSSEAAPPPTPFGKLKDGREVQLYTLTNRNNLKMTITNYGGRFVSLLVPDKNGKPTEVIVGPRTAEELEKFGGFYGATIGRFGNRIAKGKFTLEGKEYSLPLNNGPNTLHGGHKGFHEVVWDSQQPNAQTLVLSYLAKDLEEGFPGNLKTQITFTLTPQNELKVDYEATTDKTTVVNLTNHSYFNLNGEGSGSILDHQLHINANAFTPVNNTLIPTGEILPVAGTPFDFTKPTAIGTAINQEDQQLKFGKGYDHNFVLNVPQNSKKLHTACTVVGDKSGIVMEILTQEPGLQFYSGNFMRGKNTLKGGSKDEYRTAIVLEPQHFPDSPNQPSFPSTVLKPGKTYKTTSVYKFSVQK
ncbi:MAG: galactose-1-epimerase [Rufibacter sp.]